MLGILQMNNTDAVSAKWPFRIILYNMQICDLKHYVYVTVPNAKNTT